MDLSLNKSKNIVEPVRLLRYDDECSYEYDQQAGSHDGQTTFRIRFLIFQPAYEFRRQFGRIYRCVDDVCLFHSLECF